MSLPLDLLALLPPPVTAHAARATYGSWCSAMGRTDTAHLIIERGGALGDEGLVKHANDLLGRCPQLRDVIPAVVAEDVIDCAPSPDGRIGLLHRDLRVTLDGVEVYASPHYFGGGRSTLTFSPSGAIFCVRTHMAYTICDARQQIAPVEVRCGARDDVVFLSDTTVLVRKDDTGEAVSTPTWATHLTPWGPAHLLLRNLTAGRTMIAACTPSGLAIFALNGDLLRFLRPRHYAGVATRDEFASVASTPRCDLVNCMGDERHVLIPMRTGKRYIRAGCRNAPLVVLLDVTELHYMGNLNYMVVANVDTGAVLLAVPGAGEGVRLSDNGTTLFYRIHGVARSIPTGWVNKP